MMDCPNCPLKIGMAVREVHLYSLKLDIVEAEKFWETLPSALWEAYWDYAFKKAYESVKRGQYYPNHLVPL